MANGQDRAIGLHPGLPAGALADASAATYYRP